MSSQSVSAHLLELDILLLYSFTCDTLGLKVPMAITKIQVLQYTNPYISFCTKILSCVWTLTWNWLYADPSATIKFGNALYYHRVFEVSLRRKSIFLVKIVHFWCLLWGGRFEIINIFMVYPITKKIPLFNIYESRQGFVASTYS